MEKTNQLVFATGNDNKIKEVNQLLVDSDLQVISMAEAGCTDDIIEDGNSLEENALIKARYLYSLLGIDVFSEDTGLEVEALGGVPGINTARYAGPDRDPIKNMKKLLQALEGKENRNAQFRTVMALILDGKEYLFEGKVKGRIATAISGNAGFGYDPIFIAEGFSTTFAEISNEAKNQVSHRKRALAKLLAFLTNKKNKQ